MVQAASEEDNVKGLLAEILELANELRGHHEGSLIDKRHANVDEKGRGS
jgi:hypothetical protein